MLKKKPSLDQTLVWVMFTLDTKDATLVYAIFMIKARKS